MPIRPFCFEVTDHLYIVDFFRGRGVPFFLIIWQEQKKVPEIKEKEGVGIST